MSPRFVRFIITLTLACGTTGLSAQAPPPPPDVAEAFNDIVMQDESTGDFVFDPHVRLQTNDSALEAAVALQQAQVQAAEHSVYVRESALTQVQASVSAYKADLFRAEENQRNAAGLVDRLRSMVDLSPDQANQSQSKANDALAEATKRVEAARANLAEKEHELAESAEKLEAERNVLDRYVASFREAHRTRRGWIEKQPVGDPAYNGMPVERNAVIVQFREDVSAGVIIETLTHHRLRVRSAFRELRLFVTECTDAKADESVEISTARVRRIVDALRNENSVISAVPNVLLGTNVVPTPTHLFIGPNTCWDWYRPCVGIGGAKTVRWPAAWNFADAILKNGNPRVSVAVLDSGFGRHEDLQFMSVCSAEESPHGNHVMGIIAAASTNAQGVDGGTPFAEMIACAPARSSGETTAGMTRAFSKILWNFYELLKRRPRVINVSLGYNWVNGFGDGAAPETHPYIQSIVRSQGLIVRGLLRFYPEVVVSSAAGNECGGQCQHAPHLCPHEAKWSSPFNWAALGGSDIFPPVRNIFVVESADANGRRSSFSAIGGQIAAPGEQILSTVLAPRNGPLAEAGLEPGYGIRRGTSMAAPVVTAVVALMAAYNPALTAAQIRSALDVGRNPPPLVDAFHALLRSSPDARHDLADLTNDGRVDLRDFERFRVQLQKVETALPDEDVNGDRVKDALDFLYLREDLNGDNLVSRTARVEVFGMGNVTDLEVMMSVWEDPTIDRNDLASRLGSPPAVAAAILGRD